jgi:hypothetical protein
MANCTANSGTENGMMAREVASRGPNCGASQASRLCVRSKEKAEYERRNDAKSFHWFFS